MRIFLTYTITFIMAFSGLAIADSEKSDLPALMSLSQIDSETKTPIIEQDAEKTNEDKPTKLPKQTGKEFSGHYMFNGQLFYYDQKTGEFTAVNDENGKVKKNNSELPPNILTPEKDLKKEKLDFENDLTFPEQKPIRIASGSRDVLDDRLACDEWISHLLKGKKFKSQESCEDELQKKKEEALLAIDAYIEKFDKAKTALLINSELEEYERLSKIKLKKQKSIKIILDAFKKGCKCGY